MTISVEAFAPNVVDLGPLERKKKFGGVWGIRLSEAEEIGLGGKKCFENGGLPATVRKRVYSFILRLRYLRLLAEINILIALTGVKRDSDFRKEKT